MANILKITIMNDQIQQHLTITFRLYDCDRSDWDNKNKSYWCCEAPTSQYWMLKMQLVVMRNVYIQLYYV